MSDRCVLLMSRTWALTSSRPVRLQTISTVRPCPLERAHSRHARTWRDAWTSLMIVCARSHTQYHNTALKVAVALTLWCVSEGNLNELVQHGLRALRETLPAEQDLTTKVTPGLHYTWNCERNHHQREPTHAHVSLTVLCLFQNVSIGIVGKDMEFTIYDNDDVASFLEGLEERPQRRVRTRKYYKTDLFPPVSIV